MNWDQIRGRFKRLAGRLRARRGRASGDVITEAGGKKDETVGRTQAGFGDVKSEVKRGVEDLSRSMDDRPRP